MCTLLTKFTGISFSLGKTQRLKSHKLIKALFNEGKQVSSYPLKVLYMFTTEPVGLQAGFTVGTRHFRRAVDRNRIKRLIKESYRVAKVALESKGKSRSQNLVLFFIYTGKEKETFTTISSKMKILLDQLGNLVDHHEK